MLPRGGDAAPGAVVLCQDVDVTKTAQLRVYSPDVSGSGEPVPSFVRVYGMLADDAIEGNRVLEWQGRRLVCPSNLRLRVLESTVAFASAFSGMGAGLVPDAAARAAEHELRTYHKAHPGHRSHVLTSAWHVPVRWFVLFDPSDKEVYETEDGPRVRLRSGMIPARQRLIRARTILEQLEVFQAPAEELAQLASWLDVFDDESMVELDYHDVSDIFEAGELIFDNTVDLVQESLDALEAGDMMRAGECYGRVVARWAPAFSLTFSS
jgi:hypothetical protein